MRGMRAGVMAGLAAICLVAMPSVAQAAPGDVYVVDRSSRDLWKFAPGGGDATPLTEFPVASSAYGLTLGPDGFFYVADEDGPIWRVNRSTGERAEVANFGPGTNPIDVEFDSQGRLFVADYDDDSISIVNPATGAITPFAPGAPSEGGFNSLEILRDGTAYVSDESDGALYRFAPTGVRTTVADDATLDDADGVFVTPDEHYLYVGSYSRTSYERFDLRTGARTTLTTVGAPYATALLPDGRLLYPDGNDGSIRFASALGADLGQFSTDPDLGTPRGIVVEPALCGGRVPTVVGTNAAETIRGSQFADVISTLGGKDKVKALGGRDIVCGGTGKDTLIGGAGNDKLLGQAGRDVLRGGKGKDKLKGGAGKDSQKQ
jgi:Ca2+-binding RTX toxin-like protein